MKQRFTKRTRLVSALLTLAMVFTFLPFSAFAATDSYGPVYISDLIFQDETFLKYVKGFDTDNNGTLSPEERYKVTAIDVHEKEITSLKGIEFFPNLKVLLCSDNKLTSLDVSQNTELTWLVCSRNQLKELNVSSNPILLDLSCSGNKLTKLDVSNNPQLQTLYCSDNQLTSLVVGKSENLETLECYDNQLTSLDVTQNTALKELDCYNNQLTNLDVTQNKALWKLRCTVNKLTSLDVSQNTALQELYCSKNNLISLDVTQNIALKELNCYNNQLSNLDVSKNTQLKLLTCSGNNLTSLNVEYTSINPSNPFDLYAEDNTYSIAVESDRTFDLSTLPEFDVSKAKNWNGGSVNGNTLTVNKDANEVTYTYDCGKGISRDFVLNVNVVPDGSTGGGSTGGSGGGTTIPPEAGKYQLTVTDGVATVNGITRDVLNVKPGDTVTLTADTTKFPESEEFGWWEITPYGSVSNTLTGQYQRTATFTMPNENVSARAMSKSAGVSTGGDDGGGGGGAAILLVGGAAVAGLVGYGVYSYVSEQQLKALLPEGVAMPENRAQTALLLWNTAGRPEPAEAPAFKDVADPDTAKAAQWCVEHGLMDQKLGGRFAPDNSDPAYKTLNAYQQLVG